MTDDWKQEFTPEELTALGEAEPPKEEPPKEEPPAKDGEPETPPADPEGKKPPEGEPKTEPEKKEVLLTPAEEAAMQTEGARVENGYVIDNDGVKIPVDRWKKVYWEGQERGRQLDLTNKKLDLLKQKGPEEYFKLYPDEAPAGWKPRQAAASANVLPIGDKRILDMRVQGGDYDGYTLRDVMASDPDSAITMYNNYAQTVLEQISQRQESENRTRQEQENAAKQFETSRAKELFNVEDAGKLSNEQKQHIASVGRELLDWQVLNGKLHLDWEDAYKLMTYDKVLSKAKSEAATAALKGLAGTPNVPAIGNGGTPAGNTGFESMGKWTNDQMANHLDTLSEAAYTKFLKEAPASIKAKFQGIPWA